MKRLVIITGAPGVGKTTICRELFKHLNQCAWLDSDWAWMVNPWLPKTQSEKKYVEDTFVRILRGYLENDRIETVLFCWVIHAEWMFDVVIDQLFDVQFEVIKVVLICDREQHTSRMKLDGRREEQVNFPDSMDKYYDLSGHVVDTTTLSVSEAVIRVIEIIENA